MKTATQTKLKITSCLGRLLHTYPGQHQPRGRYIEVSADGQLHIGYNSENDNAVPSYVFHNIKHRIYGLWNTKSWAKNFISENRQLFQRLVDGMGEDLDSTQSNIVGTLTREASAALKLLRYIGYESP